MRKLNWKPGSCHPKDRHVFLYSVYLDCSYDNKKWCSYVAFGGRSLVGEWFDSLEEAQEDCIRLAKQILTEYHECLTRIMKSFDVSCEQTE